MTKVQHIIKFKPMLSFALSLVLISAVPGLSKLVSAQSLQRLFTTQAQRAELDRRRALIAPPEQLVETAQPEPERQAIAILVELLADDVVYALQGIVQRSNGDYTVWLNNEAIDRDKLPENMELIFFNSQRRLRIRKPGTTESFEMMPGQVLNLTQGLLLESYQVASELSLAEQAESRAIEELASNTGDENTANGSAGINSGDLIEEETPEQVLSGREIIQ